MKVPGVYCGRCNHRLKQANHTGKPQSRCPACGAQRAVRHCDRCEQPKRVPSEMAFRAIFCKACHHEASSKREAQPHRVEARERYKRENRDHVLAQAKRHYRETRDVQLRYQRDYQQRNRDKLRAKSKEWYAANAERHKAGMKDWAKRNPEKVKGYRRRHMERLKADPKRYTEYLDSRRERERFKRRLDAELRGKPLPPVPLDRYRERYGRSLDRVTVDTGPLREIIRRALRSQSENELAARSGIAPRRIYGILHDDRVSVGNADRMCVALGTTFSLVYPEAA